MARPHLNLIASQGRHLQTCWDMGLHQMTLRRGTVQSMIGTFESSGQMPGFLDAAWVSCSAGEAGGDSPGDGRTQETLEAGGNFTADWVSFGAPRSWLTQDVLYHFFFKK